MRMAGVLKRELGGGEEGRKVRREKGFASGTL